MLAWYVVKTSAVNALYRENPAAAFALAPEEPRFAFKIAMAQVMQNRGSVSPEVTSSARRAMARAPLAEEPFLVEALKALAGREDARAERLLVEARRRNPRSRMTRLILLDRYMRSGRIPKAAEEITVLHRLIPAASDVLVPELAKFARDPATRPALVGVLRTDDVLRERVLTNLATAGADPELVTGLAAAAGGRAGNQPWQEAMIASLVARGDIARAHRIWSSLPGVRAQESVIYDPRFQGLPGPPPFNWKLMAGNAGVAERGQGGGLQVEYYGRAPVELASQMLRLAPGRYRLAARVEGDASGEGARLTWRLLCAGSAGEIASLPLRGINYSPRVVAADFTVAPGCAVQTLRLDGAPSEFPEAQNVTVVEITIARAGSR